MSGFISVRVTKEERKKLLELKVERGCTTLSQAVRLLCGFPRGVDEGLSGADDIDSVGKLVREVVLMLDRLDTNNKLLYKMSQQLGVREVRHVPTEDLIKPLDAPVVYRNGNQHPALPDGFKRS